MELIFGNDKRIFINLRIGCVCNCSYCYLPDIMSSEESYSQIDYRKAINMLLNIKDLKKGKNGTILSLGCYSECWSSEVKQNTMELLKNLIVYDNPIQISTKQQISLKDLLTLDKLCKYHGQIIINVSMPTISHSADLEPGTASIADRIKMFEWMRVVKNIQFALYIRPVLDRITIDDKERYGELMDRYSLPCIVGGRYRYLKKHSGNIKDVGEGLLKEEEPNDLLLLTEYLSAHGKVYNHSINIINHNRVT